MMKQSILALVGASLLLAACGGGADAGDRKVAAPNESPVTARLGTRVCVENASSRDIRVTWIRPERPGQDRLTPGRSRCDGGNYDFAQSDVAIGISWDDNLRSTFSFNNPNIGQPTVTQDIGQSSAASACGMGDIDIGDWGGLGFSSDCFDTYGQGEAQTYVDTTGYHGLVITRLADSSADKQFTVSVRN